MTVFPIVRDVGMAIHNRNGAIMAVLDKMNVPGMTEKDYDDVSGKLTEPVRKATGFQFHAGNVTKDGVTVTEVWATRENFKRLVLDFRSAKRQGNLHPGDHRTAANSLTVGQRFKVKAESALRGALCFCRRNAPHHWKVATECRPVSTAPCRITESWLINSWQPVFGDRWPWVRPCKTTLQAVIGEKVWTLRRPVFASFGAGPTRFE
jgi:hypothetical protein